MNSYPTYQAAKIANPEAKIYKDMHGNFIPYSGGFSFPAGELCDPANYCVTLGKLRRDHGKEELGDIILGMNSGIIRHIVEDNIGNYDDRCFVLYAKALEEINLETKTYRYEKVETVFSLDRDLMHKGEYGEVNNDEFYPAFNEVELVSTLTKDKLFLRIEVTERELWIQDALEAGQFEDRRVGSQEYIAVAKIYDKLVNGKG